VLCLVIDPGMFIFASQSCGHRVYNGSELHADRRRTHRLSEWRNLLKGRRERKPLLVGVLMSEGGADRHGKRPWRKMTVARIRERNAAPYSQVVFLESARFYGLSRNNPRYDEILKNLRHAMAKKRALEVQFAAPESDIIENSLT
jgi:hypothetical protein